MHTSTKIIGLTLMTSWIIGVYCPLFAGEPEVAELTTNDIALLLPTGPDMEDQDDMARYQQLIALGARAHPALAELLQSTTDYIAISGILAVFTQSQGDKAIAKNATRQLLKRKFDNTHDEGKIRISVARLLEEIGDTADADMLYPMLDDRAEFVRVNAIRALAKIGDEKAIQQIDQFVSGKEASSSKDEIRNDTSLQEGNKLLRRYASGLPEQRIRLCLSSVELEIFIGQGTKTEECARPHPTPAGRKCAAESAAGGLAAAKNPADLHAGRFAKGHRPAWVPRPLAEAEASERTASEFHPQPRTAALSCEVEKTPPFSYFPILRDLGPRGRELAGTMRCLLRISQKRLVGDE